MKYLSLVITGLIPFFPLNAENVELEDTLSTVQVPQEEEATLASLEEELSLLDEEFEEFKEELLSLENELQTKTVAEEKILETKVPENVFSEQPQEMQPTVISDSKLQQEPMEPVSVSTASTPQENIVQDPPAVLNIQGTAFIGEPAAKTEAVAVDLNKAFSGSPIIYSVLIAMSVCALGIWMYSLLALKRSTGFSGTLFKSVQSRLNSNHFDEALSLCTEQNNLFCKMVACGIQARRHGLPVMVEAMKAEGKRASTSFWQKLGLLNDIAIIAPMIGLLGTVLGMFYAFYDVNRSMESITTLFDGLGISVGTTVAGLVVAILALILHSTAKYRIVRALAKVENEAQGIATLIDDRTSISRG